MNSASKLYLLLIAGSLILACSVTPFASTLVPPTPPATDTAISIPTRSAPTETAVSATVSPPATPQPNYGTEVSFGKVHLWIPEGLGTSTTNTTSREVEFPYTNPSNGDMPEHARLVINDYPVQGTLLAPQIHVFTAAEYAQYTDLTQQIISTLQTTQFLDGQPLPEGLPDGPFNAHVRTVLFANGRGIRYLTQFDQAVLPVNNHELNYYFHGLTTDGSTYIQAILPVQAPFLAADENPSSPLPEGGIPFNMDQLGDYFQLVADKLNATDPLQFTPPLPTLDALIQSISIK